jgi:predicted dehydrogenase
MERRTFVSSAAGLGMTALHPFPGLLRSRAPSERVRVAIMGVNGRGAVLGRVLAATPDTEVAFICDVDARVLNPAATAIGQAQAGAPATLADFRRALDDRTVDALVVAAPDHWHAPAAILALSAGKHVYLEKPGSHNPREVELLVAARRRYPQLVQLGTQRRSSPRIAEAVQLIREGAIGRAYLARAWYANARPAIGRGQPAATPEGLDYELWQGPAPRAPFQDNVVHYNWHWFRRWGTGEICNNGTHEIDVCRWALGVDYPVRVTSVGGRYHFDDDWEFTDTQEVLFEFPGGKTIIWQGASCNGFPTLGRGRGVIVQGTDGAVVIDQNGYAVHDRRGEPMRQSLAEDRTEGMATSGDDPLTTAHVANFITAIRTGTPLSQPIEEGGKTALLCHLGNIAQLTGTVVRTDAATGRIAGNTAAERMWGREYAPGWAPAV